MNNKVSVIIPMYNAESVILRAVKSVFKQTVSVDELIIVDDGSIDNSVTIVETFVRDHNLTNIRLLTKVNGGASSARNYGILEAKNEFIAFLDSDDEWVSDKIELQLPYISQDEIVLVGGNHFYGPVDRILFKKAKNVNEITLKHLLYKNFFQTSTVMTRKSISIKFGGFNENQRYAEEGQFYFNMSRYGKMIHLNKQLVVYDGGEKKGFGQSGLSGNIVEMEKGELRNLKYAYTNLNISLYEYLQASLFSAVKFLRRLLLVKVKL